MAEDRVNELAAARKVLVADRRALALALGEPYKRHHSENMRKAFMDVQETIETIDRAIRDEDRMVSPGQQAGFTAPIS
jgi:hypothetical protein